MIGQKDKYMVRSIAAAGALALLAGCNDAYGDAVNRWANAEKSGDRQAACEAARDVVREAGKGDPNDFDAHQLYVTAQQYELQACMTL